MVFLLVGIWHGVGWNFADYGTAHALGVVTNHYYAIGLKKRLGREGFKAYNANPWIHGVAVMLTFCYCAATLIFFANTFPRSKRFSPCSNDRFIPSSSRSAHNQPPQLAFHHFGLAVRRPEETRVFISTLGYRPGDPVFDPAQNDHLQLCAHDTHPAVEILWPGEAKGPGDKLIQCHPDGIIYHVCYETNYLAVALVHLKEAGLRSTCIAPPTPALLFGGRKVYFYKITGIGLVEILEVGV